MNEKTTKSDIDLNARKMKFLEKMATFGKPVKERLIQIDFGFDIIEFDDPSKKMNSILLHETGLSLVLKFYLGKDYDDSIQINIHKRRDKIEIQFPLKRDILAKCADIPFEHFTSLVEDALNDFAAKQKDN